LNAADFENNAVFLQACRDLIDSMADSAKRRQSSGAALADNVRYYGHHLESLWNRMQVLAADPNLNNPVANLPAHLRGFAAAGGAANYNIVAAAVTGDTGRRLLAVPTMQLDFIAKAYHDTRDDGGGRAQLVWAPGNPAMTFAHYGLQKVRDNFEHNIVELCTRLHTDWNDLISFFFEARAGKDDECLIRLQRVTSSGSDPHKGGKQTYMMHLEAGPANVPMAPPPGGALPGGGVIAAPIGAAAGHGAVIGPMATVTRRLIYKCADMELDTRLVGDTQTLQARVNTALPNLANGSLVEIFNQIQGDLHFPVYRILPVNAGSIGGPAISAARGAAAASDAHHPLQNSYGYLQFLDHEPDLTGVIPPGDNVDNADTLSSDPAHSDRFLRHYAWYLAMGNLTGMADAHRENVIVHAKKLHLIDTEISFKKPDTTPGEMMLDEIFGDQTRAGEHSCLFFVREGGAFIHPARRARPAGPNTAAGYVADELQAAFRAIAADDAVGQPRRVRTWLTDPHLARTVARLTLTATKIFGQRREGFWQTAAAGTISDGVAPPNLPADAGVMPDSPLAQLTDAERPGFTWKSVLKSWRLGSGDVQNRTRPMWATRKYDNDVTCYLNCDYPCHYQRLGSLDLMNARGDAVTAPNPPTLVQVGDAAADNVNRATMGPRFFQSYGRVKGFEVMYSIPITTAQLDDVANAIATLTTYFQRARHALPPSAVIARVHGPGPDTWRIVDDPADHRHEWRLQRMPDGTTLSVALVRANYAANDIQVIAAGQIERGALIVQAPNNVTVVDLNSKPGRNMRRLLTAAGLEYRTKKIGHVTQGNVMQAGQIWRLRDPQASIDWIATRRSDREFYLKPIRRNQDHTGSEAFFQIPNPVTTDELNAIEAGGFATPVGVSVQAVFAANGHALTGAAAFSPTIRNHWQIRDGNAMYFIDASNGKTPTVTLAGTAIEGAIDHFEKAMADPDGQAANLAEAAMNVREDHLDALAATLNG
jgi:hypothetical protein